MPVTPDIRIQPDGFDIKQEIARLVGKRTDIGAVVTFTGICRDEAGGLAALELEHYPAMAQAEITRIGEDAIQKFDLTGLTVIHRHGKLVPGEDIVLVIAASTHRHAAFDGAGFVMDFLKTRAPFWKKEHPSDNNKEGKWVDARYSDDTATQRWDDS